MYVHAWCIATAHVFLWWWWMEAAGVELLLAGGVVRAAGDLAAAALPGGLGSRARDALASLAGGAGGPCPTTWLAARQAAETCAALAARRVPSVAPPAWWGQPLTQLRG